VSRLFRDAVLGLAKDHAFARRLVNSGRLSVPATLRDSALNTPDADAFAGAMVPGAVAADAPLVQGGRPTCLVQALAPDFNFVVLGTVPPWAELLPLRVVAIAPAEEVPPEGAAAGVALFRDVSGLAAARYDARPGTAYLLRPDQHVCARWREPTEALVRAAFERACGAAAART